MKTSAKAIKVASSKKVASVAAVLPIVSSSTKQVFLKVAKANGVKSKEATAKALQEKRFDNFDADLRSFARTHADAHVWNSRVSSIQPKRIEKSVANQTAFWQRQGFTVVNAAA